MIHTSKWRFRFSFSSDSWDSIAGTLDLLYRIALFVLADFCLSFCHFLFCIHLIRQLEAVQLEIIERKFGIRPSFLIPSSTLCSNVDDFASGHLSLSSSVK